MECRQVHGRDERLTGRLLKRACGLILCLMCLIPSVAFAQAARTGRLIVTVVDPSGGVVPGVTVTVVGLDAATKAVTPKPVKTNEQGLATIDGLPLGRYSIQAEFPGFELGLVRDIRVQAGDNKHVVVLPIKGLEASVTVGGKSDQTGASNRDSTSFGLTVPTEQIDALSDDPNEMQQQLLDIAGPDAIIRVDSFEGQQLPPKAQIKSIHVTRDQFAAETEQPGSTFVDIVTQPGVGRIQGGIGGSARDNSLGGINQFTGQRGAESSKNYNANVGGTIVKNKSDFSLAMFGQNQFTTPILNTSTTSATLLNVRQPFDYKAFNGLLNYALTKNQSVKVGYSQFNYDQQNLGVGGYNGLDQAFSSTYHSRGLRLLEAGPIGRRTFINSRLSVNWSDNEQHSAVEAPKVVIEDASTIGGAQQTGGTHTRNFDFASDVDYVRGINSWRAGIRAYGGSYNTNQESNYLGTYTFADQAAFAAGQPLLYTRTMGDPSLGYFNAQGALYLQDDVRVSKSLTLSPGVRYSLQTHVHDYTAFEPRFGLTWAPFKSAKTTLRASAGTFHGWLGTGTLQQALQSQQESNVVIVNPTYPNPGALTAQPPNEYLVGSNYALQPNIRYSAGIDQTLTTRLRFNVLYNYIHQTKWPRGENLNPVVDGVRLDPAFGNIIETVTDAQIRRHELFVNVNYAIVPASPAVNRPRFNWRRMSVAGSYTMIHAQRNADGSFDPPPSGTVDTEWGPGPADMPYRVNVSLNSTQLRNLSAYLSLNVSDGTPYTELTGVDNNGDGVLNDRPAGVGLRSLRTAPARTLNARFQYTFVPNAPPPGVQTATPPKYRFGVYVNLQNLTNHANYVGYSGNMLSPFFEMPTNVSNPRKVDIGFNVGF